MNDTLTNKALIIIKKLKIEECEFDSIYCFLFADTLYRVAFFFHENPDTAYNFLKRNLGQSEVTSSWTRGEKELEDRTWYGKQSTVAILANYNEDGSPENWDRIVFYNKVIDQKVDNLDELLVFIPFKQRAGYYHFAKQLKQQKILNLCLEMPYDSLHIYNVNFEEINKQKNEKKVSIEGIRGTNISDYYLDSLLVYFFENRIWRIKAHLTKDNYFFDAFAYGYPNALRNPETESSLMGQFEYSLFKYFQENFYKVYNISFSTKNAPDTRSYFWQDSDIAIGIIGKKDSIRSSQNKKTFWHTIEIRDLKIEDKIKDLEYISMF